MAEGSPSPPRAGGWKRWWCPKPANMRLAHGGSGDPPPPSTWHKSATPTTALGYPSGNESVTPTTTLVCFETERPRHFLPDETAVKRPCVGAAAATTETTGRVHVSAETELGCSDIAAADTQQLGLYHATVGAETEFERSYAAADTTDLGRFNVATSTGLQRASAADIGTMVQCTQPPPQLKLPESKITELTNDENHDSQPKPEKRTRMHHTERHRSCVVTIFDIELNGLQRRLLQTIEKNPGGGSQCSLHEETPTDTNASPRHAIADAAWEALKRSIVYFRDQSIGTAAAIDKSQGAALNYDQVFMRDFIPSALAFLMKGEHLIVKNFLVETARLQSREKMVDLFKLGQGVMPASFKVHHRNPTQKTDNLLSDFGETAIGRVAPGLWWIILLRAYTKWTGDNSLAESPNCQRAMHLILRLCLLEGCDTSPALLCADWFSMLDPMDIYGYPIELQARFFMAIAYAAWEAIKRSIVYFRGHQTRTVAAIDKSQGATFNYDCFNEGSNFLNTATICLDGSDEEVLASIRRAIGRIRCYCKKRGKCVNLSRIFGPNIEVFTTAEDGTFFLKVQHKNRSIILSLRARDLYIMGWRRGDKVFEIRLNNEERYMIGKDIITVTSSKGYGQLSPQRKVGLTRMGPSAVKDGFETLYKCRGEPSSQVLEAIGRFAVHFCEAARIQSVWKTVCLTYSDPNFSECQLDNIRYNNNSFWVKRYGHYSRELMKQINDLKAGVIPKPIKNKGDDNISSSTEILREIRILLLDGCDDGEFKHKPKTVMIEELPLVNKHRKSSIVEDQIFLASILDDLPAKAELDLKYEAELDRISKMKLKAMSDSYGVKRRFTTLSMPQRRALPFPFQKPHAYALTHMEKLQAPSVLRSQPPLQPPRIKVLQPNLARATRFVGQLIRFVR